MAIDLASIIVVFERLIRQLPQHCRTALQRLLPSTFGSELVEDRSRQRVLLRFRQPRCDRERILERLRHGNQNVALVLS